MKPIGFVYLTTCLINGKVYVGQHKFSDYTKHYFGSGTLIEQALKKYGKSSFRRNILKVCYTVNQLNGWEVYYTLKYNPNLDRKVVTIRLLAQFVDAVIEIQLAILK